jgi:hypothetical protein
MLANQARYSISSSLGYTITTYSSVTAVSYVLATHIPSQDNSHTLVPPSSGHSRAMGAVAL